MNRLHVLLPTLLLGASLCCGRVLGQDPDPTPERAERDPFQSGPGQTQAVTQQLPALALGGVVLIKGRPPAALLIVGETPHVVREGSTLEVEVRGAASAPAGQRVTLEVAQIGREGVTLRVGAGRVVVR